MRSSFSFLACLVVGRVASHPLCYVDDKPTDLEGVLLFCPQAQDGACCTDIEEESVELIVEAAGPLTPDCYDLYKQVGFFTLCFRSHPQARFGMLLIYS